MSVNLPLKGRLSSAISVTRHGPSTIAELTLEISRFNGVGKPPRPVQKILHAYNEVAEALIATVNEGDTLSVDTALINLPYSSKLAALQGVGYQVNAFAVVPAAGPPG